MFIKQHVDSIDEHHIYVKDFDTKIEVFRCGTERVDSVLHCSVLKKNGNIIKEQGKCYLRFPIWPESVSPYLLELGQKQDTYETFDSLMCEVGGNSAYDKYIFSRDKSGNLTMIKHYIAWFERYEGDSLYLDYTPDYTLQDQVEIEYEKGYQIFKCYYNGDELTETLINYYDHQGRISHQSFWNNDECLKVHFTYL